MTTTAHLYVLDTMADWEPGHLIAELNTGRFFAKPDTRLPVRTVGATRDPVRTMGGVPITPDLTVDDLDPASSAVLILPGGDNWLDPAQRPVLDRAHEFLAAGTPVAAICGATLGLAAIGALDDRPHTSNDLTALQHLVPSYRGESHYRPDPVVTDGPLITASGVAPLDFAQAVLAHLDVFSPESLSAWYDLYRTHQPTHYHRLMASLPTP